MEHLRTGLHFPLALVLLGASLTVAGEDGSAGKPPAVPLRFLKLSKSCYAVLQKDGKSNAGFIVGRDAVMVVDCLGSPAKAKALLHGMRKVTDKPIRFIVLTHWHYDHIVGDQVFPAQAGVVASAAAAARLKKRLESDRLLLSPAGGMHTTVGILNVRSANETIDREKVVDLGGLKVKLSVAGDCITPGDLVVYVPSEKVLFAGDLVWNRIHPNMREGQSFRWIISLAVLGKLDLAKVVPGHGEPGGKELIVAQRRYLMNLRRIVKHLAKEGVKPKEILERLSIPAAYKDYAFKAWWAGNVRFVLGELARGR